MTTIHAAKRNWDLHREAGHSCYSRYCPANFDDLESYLDFLGISGSDSNEPESGHQNPVNENPVTEYDVAQAKLYAQMLQEASEGNNSGTVEDDATVVELLLRLTEAAERAAASLHSIERVLEKRLKRPY